MCVFLPPPPPTHTFQWVASDGLLCTRHHGGLSRLGLKDIYHLYILYVALVITYRYLLIYNTCRGEKRTRIKSTGKWRRFMYIRYCIDEMETNHSYIVQRYRYQYTLKSNEDKRSRACALCSVWAWNRNSILLFFAPIGIHSLYYININTHHNNITVCRYVVQFVVWISEFDL